MPTGWMQGYESGRGNCGTNIRTCIHCATLFTLLTKPEDRGGKGGGVEVVVIN